MNIEEEVRSFCGACDGKDKSCYECRERIRGGRIALERLRTLFHQGAGPLDALISDLLWRLRQT